MRKLTALAAALVLTASVFTACQSQKDVTIDVNKMADALYGGITFKDTLSEPMDDAAFQSIYDVDEADIVAKKVYVSSLATAEEIAVFEAKDTDAAARVRKAVDTRIENQKENYADYNPVEQKKLSDPVIVEKGRYVILCVSDDNAAARKIIDENTK